MIRNPSSILILKSLKKSYHYAFLDLSVFVKICYIVDPTKPNVSWISVSCSPAFIYLMTFNITSNGKYFACVCTEAFLAHLIS